VFDVLLVAAAGKASTTMKAAAGPGPAAQIPQLAVPSLLVTALKIKTLTILLNIGSY
jgi:hypothetical protein